jgi:hypothetical protein
MKNRLMFEAIRDEFSEDFRWVAYFAMGALATLTMFGMHVALELVKVRPMLVFVMVNGEPPPICGFSFLFG